MKDHAQRVSRSPADAAHPTLPTSGTGEEAAPRAAAPYEPSARTSSTAWQGQRVPRHEYRDAPQRDPVHRDVPPRDAVNRDVPQRDAVHGGVPEREVAHRDVPPAITSEESGEATGTESARPADPARPPGTVRLPETPPRSPRRIVFEDDDDLDVPEFLKNS